MTSSRKPKKIPLLGIRQYCELCDRVLYEEECENFIQDPTICDACLDRADDYELIEIPAGPVRRGTPGVRE